MHGVVHETVAAAHAVAAHAEQLRVDHVAAQQQHQPVHRPRETILVRAPAHRLRDRHRSDRLGEDLREQIGGLRTGFLRAVHEALALVVDGPLQRRPVDPGLGREALQRAGRLAVGVERDVEVGPEHFRGLLGLLDPHARQQNRQPTRRIQRLGLAALERDAALDQPVDHALEQRLGQRRQRLDRKFLGAQFDQQGLHRHRHHAASGPAGGFKPGKPSFSRWAKYASATPCEIRRTRRMVRWRSVTEIARRASSRLKQWLALQTCS